MDSCVNIDVKTFTHFNIDEEHSNYYRAKLMLYYTWRNEDVDIIGGCEAYKEYYNIVKDVVLEKESEDPYNNRAVASTSICDVTNTYGCQKEWYLAWQSC